MKKFTIRIYGCQMNYADSGRIKKLLENIGMKYVENINQADIVIFDSCSVRQKAEDKIFGKLQNIPKDTKIWITGCVPGHKLNINKIKKLNPKIANQINTNFKKGNFIPSPKIKKPQIIGTESLNHSKEGNKIYNLEDIQKGIFINYSFGSLRSDLKSSFENLELFFRIDDLPYLPYLLKSFGYKNIQTTNAREKNYCEIQSNHPNFNFADNKKTAMVPIQTGCSQFCSYCIVPYARGLEKNRSIENILKEVQQHIQNGTKEIILIGQIVNKHPNFNEIIKKLLKYKQIKRIRYTSPYPTYYNDELFKLHEENKKLAPHIHIPVQSGSNKILKKMNRGYTIKEYKTFIDKIRKLNRKISITSDIIVGFPSETQKDFEKTLELAKYAQFDMVYLAKYSPRPGTQAAKKYDDSISDKVKKQRFHKLTDILEDISHKQNQKEIGKIKDIMITQTGREHISGYCDNYKKISLTFDPDKREKIKDKDFIKGKITDGTSFKLQGKAIL